mmetsp:Transcript_7188/g.6285  ORF Transcript_7188/g.6285 Transcript_7188/m.6285 type:complete len:89 (+) Transcript_7188:762-1028(+)
MMAYLEHLIITGNARGMEDFVNLMVDMERKNEQMAFRVNKINHLKQEMKSYQPTSLISQLEKIFYFSKNFEKEVSLFLKQFICKIFLE